MITRENSPVGYYLTDAAIAFGATSIERIGGNAYMAHRPDGRYLRMIADEGIGSTEEDTPFPAAFESAWDAEVGYDADAPL